MSSLDVPLLPSKGRPQSDFTGTDISSLRWFGGWNGGYTLNDRVFIPHRTVLTSTIRWLPTETVLFRGRFLFVIEPDEALSLIKANRKNREVLFPFLNGQDLNNRPDLSANQW